ncbi:MAG TPA: GDYXXLXY domain-containing protein [Anaerohalosphaeraceae bacterium]|nr:GDYXXLXY domain-containing protein [Anaerohalosphaeraceae bacterium]HOL89351.1 GDYXXLXY domain-containing protein [Anaerohalosphaeraceae bacterium]HPP56790.1 GDYXXLXY domain-containing protein [Anaerohalosphaeraceae bacterium]
MAKQTVFFALAVGFQLAILAAVPARQIHARLTGTLITIRTAPVDPYDFLSGYHVVLRYEISQVSKEQWAAVSSPQNPAATVYAVLKKGPEDIWSLESLSRTLPKNLSPEQIAVKGRIHRDQILYGIEHFFIPEEGRNELETALRNNRERALAQIRVDKYGNAALIRLIVQGKTYEY